MTPGGRMEGRIDGRQVAAWAVLLSASVLVHAYVEVATAARSGMPLSIGRALAIETSSHLVIAALLPVLYWMHARWPLGGRRRNLAFHIVAVAPFSFLHTLGLWALRQLWFAGVLGEAYSLPLTIDRFGFEFAKDIFNYGLLSAGVLAMRHFFAPRASGPVETVLPADLPPTIVPAGPAPVRPERFAVRKGGREILVAVADIDWIEAAGNYAVLHVGGDTLEIRSSLSRLEGELDPRRFVRVHKSAVVNVARIAEVTPWMSGDWRIRLHDGAEVNLSRRYRARFEALVPVKS
jgi:hypothetical protein